MEAALTDAFRAALARLDALPDGFDADGVAIAWEAPRDPSHGDLATNVAMTLARPLRRAPRQIAEALVAGLDLDPRQVAAVEVAGPGFINVRLATAYLTDALAEIRAAGASYGRAPSRGETAIVEYVSANPTGPLTVAHGRNAVLGDTLANLLDWQGYDVTREYYFNDAGRQMRMLGQSVRARYEHLLAPDGPTRELDDGTVVPASFPDDGYRGDYIVDVARALADEHGDALLAAEDEAPFTAAARDAVFAEIEASLVGLGVHMDRYFNERDLYDNGAVWDVVERLKAKGLAYEEDGAVWFATGKLGKTVRTDEGEVPKDTVLVKSTGEPTYRLPDIAYHLDKLDRGFDRIVDVFGADHVATYPDVIRGVRALGGDASKIDVLVYQFVTLIRDGEMVKMSTRKATYETLDDLVAEVGADVVRYFFLMRAPGTHLEFDLGLATEAKEKNPVFYLQYAHARICQILGKAAEAGLALDPEPDLALLTHPSAIDLIKTLVGFPDAIRTAAEAMGPHRLAEYLRGVATAFSAFYRDCHILGEAEALGRARLALADATRIVLANGLAVLGLSAPERM